MSAETIVTDQIEIIKAYGTGASEAAIAALGALAKIDVPYPSISSISFESLRLVEPVLSPVPGDVVIGTPPAISTISEVEQPNKPDIPTYDLGVMLSITMPDLPTIEFPELNISAPSYTISSPAAWSFQVGDILISDDPMIQAALDRLRNNIANGGTGLTPEVEAYIWNRDLERNEQTLMDSTDKVTSMWAKKGFSLPDGLLAHSLSEIQKEYMNKRLDASREIAIKQAELEQSNLFKSLELSVNLTSQLIGLLIRYEELVFRGQEATARFANEYIDLQIKTYASLLDAYRTTAQVHETIVRAQVAKVELYKAQIQGQMAILGVNEQTVKIYSEQLRATTVLIDRYKAEVDVMTAMLGVEKVKIEANKLQMDAWTTEANTRIAKYNGEIEIYKVSSQIGVSVAELQTSLSEANLRMGLAAAEINIKAVESYDRIGLLGAQSRMEAARGMAQAAASLAAGAMAAMNAQARIAYDTTKDET